MDNKGNNEDKDKWEDLETHEKFRYVTGIVKKWVVRVLVLVLVGAIVFSGLKFFKPEKVKYDKEKLLTLVNYDLEEKVRKLEAERETTTIPSSSAVTTSLPEAKESVLKVQSVDPAAVATLAEKNRELFTVKQNLIDRDREINLLREDLKKQRELYGDLETKIKDAEEAKLQAETEAKKAKKAEVAKAAATEKVTQGEVAKAEEARIPVVSKEKPNDNSGPGTGQGRMALEVSADDGDWIVTKVEAVERDPELGVPMWVCTGPTGKPLVAEPGTPREYVEKYAKFKVTRPPGTVWRAHPRPSNRGSVVWVLVKR